MEVISGAIETQDEMESGVQAIGLGPIASRIASRIALQNVRACYAADRKGNEPVRGFYTMIINATNYLARGRLQGDSGSFTCGRVQESTQTVPQVGKEDRIIYPTIQKTTMTQ